MLLSSFFTFILLKRKITASSCYLYFVSQSSSGSSDLLITQLAFCLDEFTASFGVDFGAPCKLLQKSILK